MSSQELENSEMHTPEMPDGLLLVSGAVDVSRTYTMLRMPDGRVVRIPTSLLLEPSTRTSGLLTDEQPEAAASTSGDDEAMVIPIVEEQLSVGRRTVATGKVYLKKVVEEYKEALDEPLAVRTFDIERVVLNKTVTAAPGVRVEGDTTIYPLVEEQLVLTKRLILKEEVRVIRRDTERRDTQVVTLRREHITVERDHSPSVILEPE